MCTSTELLPGKSRELLMVNENQMCVIAHIYTDFPEKFGIPRQSGLVESLCGKIVFEPEFRNPDAFHGLEGFSHIWLLWKFSQNHRTNWSATVKPPRLGGNKRMGVFATRSPFRPNDIGLSCVKLERIEFTKEEGPVLYVRGADLMDRTPIYDIKPYLAYADAHPDATEGFAGTVKEHRLLVDFPEKFLSVFPAEKQQAIVEVLSQDPRPAYQEDPEHRYGVSFAGYDVRFYVKGQNLTVCEVVKLG